MSNGIVKEGRLKGATVTAEDTTPQGTTIGTSRGTVDRMLNSRPKAAAPAPSLAAPAPTLKTTSKGPSDATSKWLEEGRKRDEESARSKARPKFRGGKSSGR